MKIQYETQEFESENIRKMFMNKNIFVIIDAVNVPELPKNGVLKIVENGTILEELNVMLLNQELDYVNKKTFLTFQYY
jgi:hypothetical protein